MAAGSLVEVAAGHMACRDLGLVHLGHIRLVASGQARDTYLVCKTFAEGMLAPEEPLHRGSHTAAVRAVRIAVLTAPSTSRAMLHSLV